MSGVDRRTLLKIAGRFSALPWGLSAQRARAQTGGARRLIVFYFPDGIAGASAEGEPSEWHPAGSESVFLLGTQLEPLSAIRGDCLFINGLSMGPTDAGSHPGGAKKLLTATDGGYGESIDQLLARTAGASSYQRLLYLGVMANQNGASGDKHLSYPAPGQTTPPEDDPRRAFGRLFGGGAPAPSDPGPSEARSILDAILGDLHDLRARLGNLERRKLDLHLEALREIEARLQNELPPPASCSEAPASFAGGPGAGELYDPARFPALLRMQSDLMVQAMACGLTKVGLIQCSHHTSELIMSRFAGTAMYDPGFDMRSHQASHYGPRHDPSRREYRDYVAQRRWFVEQFAYLVEALRARPEDGGTMLDHSLLVLCSEVSDGNTHGHDQMPFILAGGAGGRLRTGRLLDVQGAGHGQLWTAVAQLMGHSISRFGDGPEGALPGVIA
jgi:hypothetical protein